MRIRLPETDSYDTRPYSNLKTGRAGTDCPPASKVVYFSYNGEFCILENFPVWKTKTQGVPEFWQ